MCPDGAAGVRRIDDMALSFLCLAFRARRAFARKSPRVGCHKASSVLLHELEVLRREVARPKIGAR
jgi:hypothetical protein